VKYPTSPLTPFFAAVPQNFLRCPLAHSRVSRTAQTLSARASMPCALLFTLSLEGNSLVALFATPILCFQSLAASFAKYRGVGGTAQNRLAASFQLARVFNNLQVARSIPSINMSRIFMYLQIALRANPLFSNSCKLPGVSPRENNRFLSSPPGAQKTGRRKNRIAPLGMTSWWWGLRRRLLQVGEDGYVEF
jgi:hypothetical protein